MVRKSVLYTAGIAVCVGSMVMAGPARSAGNQLATGAEQLAEARVLVEEYRSLRRTCAKQTGDARKSCFHALRAGNGDYRLAKQRLGLMESADPENIHLVTF